MFRTLFFDLVAEKSDQAMIRLTMKPELLESFVSVFRLLSGDPVFLTSMVIETLRFLHSSFLKIPDTVEQAFEIIFLGSQDLSFDLAIDFLAKNFILIEKKDLLKMRLSVVEAIFSSPSLFLPNEDVLFESFLFLLKHNKDSICLAKYIHLYAVSSTLLAPFLNDISLRDVEEELFNCLKTRLCFSVIISNEVELPLRRWSDQHFLSNFSEKDCELNSLIDSLSNEKVDSKTKILRFTQQFLLLEEKYRNVLIANEELNRVCFGKEEQVQFLKLDIQRISEQLNLKSQEYELLKGENSMLLAQKTELSKSKVQSEEISLQSSFVPENIDFQTHLQSSEKENQQLKFELETLKGENEFLSKEVNRLIFLLESKKGEKAKVIEDYENLVSHVAEIQVEFKRALEERDRKNQTFCSGGYPGDSFVEDILLYQEESVTEDIDNISGVYDQNNPMITTLESNQESEVVESLSIFSGETDSVTSGVCLEHIQVKEANSECHLFGDLFEKDESFVSSSSIISIEEDKAVSEVASDHQVEVISKLTPQQVSEHLNKGKAILHSQNKGAKAIQEMAEHFRVSADYRDVEGLVLFGCCLFRGWGVNADPNLARVYFEMARDLGSVEGLVWYWICDWENGAVYFKEAADKAHPGALFWYGVCLFYGFVPNADQSQAKKYFELTFEAGDSYWGNQFASLYRLGYFGISQSEDWANHYEEIASSRPTNDTSFFYPGFF